MRTSILAHLVTFVLCVATGAATASAQGPDNKLRVGALLTLSGSFASAGADCREGIEAAITELGRDTRIEIIFADSKNEATTAISEIRKLSEIDRAAAVYANRAAMAMPLNPVAKGLGLPLVAAASHDAFVPNNPFAFQTWPSSTAEGSFIADQFRRREHKKIGIVYSEDEWTIASASAFRKAFVDSSNKAVLDQSVPSTDTDFRTLLLKIKSSDADALYVNLVLPQLAPFFRQAQDLNIRIPAYTNFYIAKKEVLEGLSAKAVENVSYYDVDAGLTALEKKVVATGEKGLAPLTAVSYIATYLLNQAARESKGSSAKEMYEALLRQREVRTPDKVFAIVDRYLQIPLVLKTVKVSQ